MIKKLAFFLVTITCLFLSGKACFAADNSTHLDAILVVDVSNSMNSNDKNRLAIEGVKLFIDMLEVKGSRVGVICFNGELTTAIPLTEINTPMDKAVLKSKIDNIKYEGYTDIGLALTKAVELLSEKADDAHMPLVIMFTDGYIETDPNGTRTDEQSAEEVNAVIKMLYSVCPVYTIGLDANSRVDKDLLEKISEETYGQNYMTSNPNDLPSIFNEIFAQHIRSSIINTAEFTANGQDYTDVTINIPNNSVMEANIVILSGDRLVDVYLNDPSLTKVDLHNNQSVFFNQTDVYTIIKILSPTAGDWNLSVKGVSGDEIKVNLLYIYDLQLTAYIKSTDHIKGGTVTFGAKLTSNGKEMTDPYLINSFDVYIRTMESFLSSSYYEPTNIMKWENNEFVGEYKLDDIKTGQFMFQVTARGDGFNRSSEFMYVDIQNLLPQIIQPIDNIHCYYIPFVETKYEIDLREYITDADDAFDTLDIEVSGLNESVSYDKASKILTFIPKGMFTNETYAINISVKDNESEAIEISFDIKSVSLMMIIIVTIVLVIIMIGIAIAVKSTKEKNRMFKGRLKTVIIKNGEFSERQEDLTMYRGRLSLNRFIDIENIGDMPDLAKVTFVQAKASYTLVFNNNSIYSAYTMTKKDKIFMLEQGSSVSFKNEDNNATLKITYIN